MFLNKYLFQICFIFLFSINTANAASTLKFENAWSPEAPPVAKVMAGYVKIKNTSDKDIKIVSAKSDAFSRVEIHRTEMKDGMMRMTKQDNLTIQANNNIELKAGGLHMMLMGKLKPIKTGSVIPVTLTLDNGETAKIKFTVKVNNEPEMMHHHHHH